MSNRSNQPRTLAWEPLDSEHILAAERVPVEKVIPLLYRSGKAKWLTYIQQKAKFDCCRKVENLDIEAWFSKASEKQANRADIYKFYCKVCERKHNEGEDRGYCHVMFCVGGTPAQVAKAPDRRPDLYDIRPLWEIR